MGTMQIKRIYEPAAATDGVRILVDRLWPRGVKKESAQVDEWMKGVAPSTALRKWIHHDPSKWQEFEAKYKLELKDNSAVKDLREIIEKDNAVTLLYAARNEEQNHAQILLEFIKNCK
jgi:uncharacterized protein YeaO (DUF488 family)